MKTRTGNKVKNKKNNIHNEKGWLALNGLANLYFLFLEKVNARVIFSSKRQKIVSNGQKVSFDIFQRAADFYKLTIHQQLMHLLYIY